MKRILALLTLVVLLVTLSSGLSLNSPTQTDREAYAKMLEAGSAVKHPERKATVTADGTRLTIHTATASQKDFDELVKSVYLPPFLATLRGYGFTEYAYTNDKDVNFSIPTKESIPPTTDTGEWSIDSKVNPMDGVKTTTAALQAANDSTVSLIVRCQGRGKPDIYVSTGHVVENSLGVRYRFDNEKPNFDAWERSTDYTALFAHGTVKLMQRLMQGTTLVFEYHPYQRVATSVVFNLKGLPNVCQ